MFRVPLGGVGATFFQPQAELLQHAPQLRPADGLPMLAHPLLELPAERYPASASPAFAPVPHRLRSDGDLRRARRAARLRLRGDIFHAHPALTPNRSASSTSVPLPAACASNNFLRRSSLYARAI